jgi:hypothetical protein
VVKRDGTIARLPALHTGSNGHNGSGDFMAEDLGGRYKSMLDFLDVGAADSACAHAKQYFS